MPNVQQSLEDSFEKEKGMWLILKKWCTNLEEKKMFKLQKFPWIAHSGWHTKLNSMIQDFANAKKKKKKRSFKYSSVQPVQLVHWLSLVFFLKLLSPKVKKVKKK